MNTRIFLAKKPQFCTESLALLADIKKNLHLANISAVTVYDGFDVFNTEPGLVDALTWQVLGDPTTDVLVDAPTAKANQFVFSLEYLPGQFDQRADAAEQLAKLLSSDYEKTVITSFKTYIVEGELNADQQAKIKHYLLNPIESREKDLNQLQIAPLSDSEPVNYLDGFSELDEAGLLAIDDEFGLSLSIKDLRFIQDYFKGEGRNPSETEIRVLDTYWSDHCRHTTFLTEIGDVHFEIGELAERLTEVFANYQQFREISGISKRPFTLMDLATINARTLRKKGKLPDVEVSDEINACSVFVDVLDKDDKAEKWLLQFKNETHNHPTEIEPFGGASTCLGGAIRDPLSGRSYIYQAVRVSGAANPLEPVEDTLPGKLPQYKICRDAAKGFSSYGNQIGVASTQVNEIYHPGYKAKRMEVGAVVAAAPAENVIREQPQNGDVIILVGGKTGRDGCGGASGSSKAHTEDSLLSCGAEVQKGNPPVERAIQRLFRHPEVAKSIKKCNDFGAGGVCVAIGELADSLEINLDAVPVKYQGLSGTELTISESQERMAVVVAPESVEFFLAECHKENAEATVVAKVTDSNRLRIVYQGQAIVDLSREFLDSAGAKHSLDVAVVKLPDFANSPFTQKVDNSQLPELLADLKNASQHGLQDMFDSNVGASTVLLPYGGQYQASPSEGSVQLLPKAGTSTASVMTWGFNPEISEFSPFHGGAYAVVEAVAKQVALGADYRNIRLSLQEYFEKLGTDPEKWGKPYAALMGAFAAQHAFSLAAIGGKDSMSGSFGELHVPPTLIAFAVSTVDARKVISSEIKVSDKPQNIYILRHTPHADHTPDFAALLANFKAFTANQQKISSAFTVKHSGAACEIAKAAMGNRVGVSLDIADETAFGYGSIVVVSDVELKDEHFEKIGQTTDNDNFIVADRSFTLDELFVAYRNTLEPVYPMSTAVQADSKVETLAFTNNKTVQRLNFGQPKIFVPVFPGTNSEYDLTNAFNRNGGDAFMQMFVNLSQTSIAESLDSFAKHIDASQIFAISGGFSAGDEPNGSGKYIAAILNHAKIREALLRLLERDGLILGICNGFQALVKSGLLPYGQITPRQSDDVTLVHNDSHRHIARIASTRICHTNSPWLSDFNVGDIQQVAFSHGEGRFVADAKHLQALIDNQQIATQYVDFAGNASMANEFNPNGSDYAIEGITSPCGKILGKMGHSERYATHTYQNYPDFTAQNIFKAGVDYFN